MSEEARAHVAVSTVDGRLVYLSASARPAMPGLEQVLTDLLYTLAQRSYVELHGGGVRVEVLRILRKQGFQVDDVNISVSYRCPQCNASIQLNPEVVVYVCPYCGWAGDVYGKPVKVRVWGAGHRATVERLIHQMGGTPVSVELRNVPFWVFEAGVEAYYSATVVYRERRMRPSTIHPRSRGSPPVQEYDVVTRQTNVSGRVAFRTSRAFLARLQAEVFGGESLRTWVERKWSFNPPKELEAGEAKPLAPSILAPELSEKSAVEALVDELEDEAAREVKRHASRKSPGEVVEVRLRSFSPRVTVEQSTLVFVPYWFFTYRKGGSLYSGACAGSEATLLKVELPISNAERVLRLAGSWLTAILTGLAAQLFFGAEADLAGLLIVVGLGLAGAFALVSSAFKPAKVG
ncbi:MAG: hypothetical protein N3E41_07750 [Thermofilaceae archaeon]|nr:hypothetical protein [Thermofilaceae archaeon]